MAQFTRANAWNNGGTFDNEVLLWYAKGVGAMQAARLFCIYGPFNYGGRHTSESNARFDAMLRLRDPQGGLRDLEAVAALGKAQAFSIDQDHAMPANNRLLVFRR